MEKQNKKLGFGSYLKQLRKAKRISLRQFCKDASADPGNVSRIERGIWPPPQDSDILERYAIALQLPKGGDEWYQFFDLAAADRGIIPRDLMEDEELVSALPAFFRTLRGQRPTEEEMRKMAEKIRKS